MAKHTLPRIFDPAANDPPHAFSGTVNVYASSIPATVQSKAYLGIACMVSGRSGVGLVVKITFSYGTRCSSVRFFGQFHRDSFFRQNDTFLRERHAILGTTIILSMCATKTFGSKAAKAEFPRSCVVKILRCQPLIIGPGLSCQADS
jgi:hypothetical protein